MVITEKTNVAISLLLSFGVGLGSAVWWASGIQAAQAEIQAEQESLRITIRNTATEYHRREEIFQESIDRLNIATAEVNAKLSLLIDYVDGGKVGPSKFYRKR